MQPATLSRRLTQQPLRRARESVPGRPPILQTLQHRQGRKPMSDLQAIADRVEIEALRGEFTDAVMMRDYDRLASLFTPDGAVRIPHVNAESAGREEIRAGIERLQALLDYFVQTTHPGTIRLDGNTASAAPTCASSAASATAARS